MKKFEEGVFSDLRNLKPGVDACLEEPKVSGLSLVLLPFHLFWRFTSPYLAMFPEYISLRAEVKPVRDRLL